MKKKSIMEESLDFRQQRILLVAAELFLKKGLNEVKMTDIAEAAGIGVASLYRYYRTKTAIAIRAGTILWKDTETLFRDEFEQSDYAERTGLEQIAAQFDYLLRFYREHRDFVSFLDAFDALMLAEKVPPEELRDYEAGIVDLKSQFLLSCGKGQKDGSIREGLNYQVIYLAATHALTAMAQKFGRGPILPGDRETEPSEELKQMKDMLTAYLAA